MAKLKKKKYDQQTNKLPPTSVGAHPSRRKVSRADGGRLDGVPETGLHAVEEVSHDVGLVDGGQGGVLGLPQHRLLGDGAVEAVVDEGHVGYCGR